MTAVAKGSVEMLELILMNKSVNIDVTDPASRINSFWLACLYNRGDIMNMLAEAGINVYVHNQRRINALHLATYKNHIDIVKQLLNSNFPIELETEDGMNALYLSA